MVISSAQRCGKMKVTFRQPSLTPASESGRTERSRAGIERVNRVSDSAPESLIGARWWHYPEGRKKGWF